MVQVYIFQMDKHVGVEKYEIKQEKEKCNEKIVEKKEYVDWSDRRRLKMKIK